MYLNICMYITLEKCPNIMTVVSNIHNIQAFYKKKKNSDIKIRVERKIEKLQQWEMIHWTKVEIC